MQNATLKVEGMSCGHCVSSVEGAISKLGATGKVDLASKSVFIEYEETKLTLKTIEDAIEDQGYDILK